MEIPFEKRQEKFWQQKSYAPVTREESQELGFQQQSQQQSRSEADQSGSADLIFPTHKNHPAHSMRGG